MLRCFNRPTSRVASQWRLFSTDSLEPQVPDYTVIPTNIPTVYTCTPLDPFIDFTFISNKAGELFKMPTRYVPPKDLNFKLPVDGLPEFAFVGRSNVGKSTLVGTLLNDLSLGKKNWSSHAHSGIKISKTPGCTQNVNYFAFQSHKSVKAAYLVDLPGYGYANAAKIDRQQWSKTMTSFLEGRDFLTMRRVYLLIDSRRGVKVVDEEMMTLLNKAGLPYQIIMTKTDLVSKRELKECLESIFLAISGKNRNGCFPFVHAVSSKTGDGIAALKKDIASVVYREFGKIEVDSEGNPVDRSQENKCKTAQ